MLFPVDFSIRVNGNFHTVHTELIFANSVSECKQLANEISKTLSQENIHIFLRRR
jgi:hypothetical protein